MAHKPAFQQSFGMINSVARHSVTKPNCESEGVPCPQGERDKVGRQSKLFWALRLIEAACFFLLQAGYLSILWKIEVQTYFF